ncbi:MAG: hypothetical protein FWG75_00400 [Cystobacterineae bacterium]|nr:hypothetical protein [Cystobacterineae bacterium]
MRGFSRTLFSKASMGLVLLGLWACPIDNKFLCKEEGDSCPYGSFCFTATGETGVCTWGEWTTNEDGVAGIFPKVEVSLLFPEGRLIKDLRNPKIQFLRIDSTTATLSILAYGATSIPEPSSVGDGLAISCEPETSASPRMERRCTLEAPAQPGGHGIRLSAENSNGANTVFILWEIESDT